MQISTFLTRLEAKGYCSFTFPQVKEALGVSDAAIRAALRRLKEKGELSQPLSGFYIIVPPEYRILECRPADHFIFDLMRHIKASYYIGLLSAAQYYGAAHHRPQQFQVITNQKRRSITCGRIKIVFITKKNSDCTPTQNFNTSQGIVRVSSPEATAIDMVTYPDHCGGLDNVLTVLMDLVKKLERNKLVHLASTINKATEIQRLGYLLDLIKANDLSDGLFQLLKNRRVRSRLLVASPKNPLRLKNFP